MKFFAYRCIKYNIIIICPAAELDIGTEIAPAICDCNKFKWPYMNTQGIPVFIRFNISLVVYLTDRC
jgi:hypothetical protein